MTPFASDVILVSASELLALRWNPWRLGKIHSGWKFTRGQSNNITLKPLNRFHWKSRYPKIIQSHRKISVMDGTSLPDRPKPSKTQKQKAPKPPKATKAPNPRRAEAAKAAPDDTQLMFKVGFLADVYQERSVESGAIDKVVTRVRVIDLEPGLNPRGDC